MRASLPGEAGLLFRRSSFRVWRRSHELRSYKVQSRKCYRFLHSRKTKGQRFDGGLSGKRGCDARRCKLARVDELTIDQAGGAERRRQSRTQKPQGADRKCGRSVVDFECEMRLRLGRLAHAAGEQQVPVSDRPKAGQVIDRTRRAPIDSPASGIDVELRQRSKFLAVRVVNPN